MFHSLYQGKTHANVSLRYLNSMASRRDFGIGPSQNLVHTKPSQTVGSVLSKLRFWEKRECDIVGGTTRWMAELQ